jgi:hypothetical protein
MSFKVAVVCEDPTLDQYIVRPIVQSVLAHLGKPRARVLVVTDPHLRGIDDVKTKACAILAKYAIANAVLYLVDCDCEDGRQGTGDRQATLSTRLAQCPVGGHNAIAVCAIHEVEVWALWGIRDELGTPWTQVRESCHPKEQFFAPLLSTSDAMLPDRGRTRLIKLSLAGGWASLRQGCPELEHLEVKLGELIG